MKRSHFSFPARVSLIYGIGAGLWILLSDRMLELLFRDIRSLSLAQTYKGWFFVAATGLTLYLILRQEVTSRTRAEQAYKDICENAIEGFFQSSPAGRYLTVNPAMAQIYGYDSPSEMIASITDIAGQVHVDQESRSRFIELIEKNGKVEKFEAPNLRKDKSIIWTSTNARIVRDGAGRILYFEGFVEDITERKAMESSLSEAQTRYREIVEQIPASVYTDAVDDLSTNLYSSPQVVSITGYSPQEWLDDPGLWSKLLHPEDREWALKLHFEANKSGNDYNAEYRIITRSGRVAWIRDHAKMILNEYGEPLYWQGILLDITEQKKADEAIRQSEERFSKVFQSSPIPTCITTWQDGRFIDANPAYWALSGFEPEELVGRTVIDMESNNAEKHARFLERLKQQKSIQGMEDVFITKSGEVLDVLIFYEIIRLNDQDCILSMFHDITERKRADRFLREAEARYRALVENIPAVVYMDSAADASTIYLNPQIEALTGYTPEEWKADNLLWEKSLHPDDRERVLQEDRATNENGNPFQIEYRLFARGGNVVWVRELASLIRDNEGKPLFWQGVIIDITGEKRAQESLLRREAILGAIAYAADQFLKSDKWKNNITPILDRLGVVSETSRVYIFQRDLESGRGSAVSMLYEWCAPGIPSQMGCAEFQNMDMKKAGLQRWMQRFEQGEPIHGVVRQLPEQEQDWFLKGNALSQICVPIMIGRTWWGFIGFDDCNSARVWTPSEIDALRTASNIISAAVQKEQTTDAVRRQLREITMLHSVALASSSASSLDELIVRVTHIIGDTLVPDTYGILLVTPNGQALQPHTSYQGTDKKNMDMVLNLGQGITGQAALTKAPVRIGDVSKHPGYIEVTSGIKSELCVPIISDGSVIGVINLESKAENAFAEADERLINTIAGGIGTAIGKLRLFEAQQRRAREADGLREATSALTKSLDLQTLLELTLGLLPNFAPFDSASILLKNTDEDMYIAAIRGLPDDFLGRRIESAGKWESLGTHHEPLIIVDASQDERFLKIAGTEYIRGWMGVPLVVNEQVIGLLNLDSRIPDTYTREHATLVQTFANQAAIAIQNARLFAAEQDQRHREASILDLMRVAASSLDLEVVIENILRHLVKLIPSDAGSIQLLEEDQLLISAVIGIDPEAIQPGNALHLEDYPLNHEVVTKKHPVRIGNVEKDSRYRWIPGVEHFLSILAVPILFKGEVIGIATLDSRQPDRFTIQDEQLALAIANHAAIAIGNARLFESEQQRRQEAENLRVAASAVTSSLDPKQVLETILVALKQVVPYDSASMLLLDGDMVRITAAKGLPMPDLALNQSFPSANRLLSAIHETGKPLILYDAQEDPRFERWASADKIRGWMGVPLTVRGQIVGFITLDSQVVGSFDDKSASLAQTFAHQAALAIDNSRLFEETRRRLEEMEIISRISFTLRAAQDADEMLPILFSEVMTIMKTDTGSIWLFDDATGRLEQKIAGGWAKDVAVKEFRPSEGIVGHVFSTGEPYLVQDFSNDPHSHPDNRESLEPNWSGIVLPIRTTTDTIGVIVVAVPNSRRVEPHQLQLMTTIAEIAGNSMHRINLFDHSQDQVRRLVALRDVDMAIAGSFDLQVTLNILLDHIVSQLKVDAAVIHSFNPDMQILSPLANLGFYRQANAQVSLRISSGPAAKILIDRTDVHIPYLSLDAGFRHEDQLTGEGFVSYYATPLVSKGQTKGVLETFFRQPFSPGAYWLEFLHAMAGQAAIAIDNAQLFENLQRSNQELSLAYDTTLEGWGKALELRDKETQGHTLRVTDMTLRLARRMGIPESELSHIRRGVLLHDIGKMGVPDHILKKTGSLSEEEWAEMRQHPRYAYDLLYPITYLRRVLDIPYCHHERWDGSGYPRGLRGEDIPLAARVFAVVDVWDALLYDRPYRKAWSQNKVFQYIADQAGSRFDPAVAKVFLQMIEDDQKAG